MYWEVVRSALREIEAGIRGDNGLSAAVNRSALSRILNGSAFPSLAQVQALGGWLARQVGASGKSASGSAGRWSG